MVGSSRRSGWPCQSSGSMIRVSSGWPTNRTPNRSQTSRSYQLAALKRGVMLDASPAVRALRRNQARSAIE